MHRFFLELQMMLPQLHFLGVCSFPACSSALRAKHLQILRQCLLVALCRSWYLGRLADATSDGGSLGSLVFLAITAHQPGDELFHSGAFSAACLLHERGVVHREASQEGTNLFEVGPFD